jgi:acetaldehyde dehydrogenase
VLASIDEAVAGVQQYVPGYRLRTDPIFDEGKITVFVEVEGEGAYLPTYAGNLDIETAAAIKVGQEFAKHLLAKRGEAVEA